MNVNLIEKDILLFCIYAIMKSNFVIWLVCWVKNNWPVRS